MIVVKLETIIYPQRDQFESNLLVKTRIFNVPIHIVLVFSHRSEVLADQFTDKAPNYKCNTLFLIYLYVRNRLIICVIRGLR